MIIMANSNGKRVTKSVQVNAGIRKYIQAQI